MAHEKHVTESQLDQLRSKSRDEKADFRRRTWQSLKTVAGWLALSSLLGAAVYGLLGRAANLLHIGPR